MSSAEDPAAAVLEAPGGSAERSFARRIEQLEVAVADADNGAVTNARKMEALSALEDAITLLARPEISKQQSRVEDLLEKLLAQNATEPLRRLAVCVLNSLYKHGDGSQLPNFVGRLLKVTGEQSKKVANDTRVAALDMIGELMVQHGRTLDGFSTDIFVVVARHMKLPEASARCSAFQCLCKTIAVAGVKTPSIAGNIWKMLQKMLLDKAMTVRTAAAHALSALVVASPTCANANGADMAVCCLKALASDDQASHTGALSSECRFAFAAALARVLAAMSTPMPTTAAERPKKRPAVTDFASALEFLEQAAAKGPSSGPAYVTSRAAIGLAAVKLAEALAVADSAGLILVMRMLLNTLDGPAQSKAKGGSGTEDDWLAQVARHLTGSLRHLLLLADTEALLLEVIEQGLVPLVSAQFHDTSRTQQTDLRLIAVLETLCSACTAAGEGFRSIETKMKQPLLHLVGNHPSPLVQLHATYCMRVVAHSSPSQLFPLMSVLLNHITVLNAELLGAPTQRRRDGPGGLAAGAQGQSISTDLQPLLRGLFGHCAALAALAGELFHSSLGVPHDVTSAVLGTSRALLQPHPNANVSAQRRSCAFLLLEGLMCLGTDWVGQRLTTLFALWKTALGKKPVDRAKVLYQQHVATGPQADGGSDGGAGACRDELLALLCALRSLYAFTWHSHQTLLTSLPHLHKILVVFLTNISQLVVALPHPTSASLRAKYRNDPQRPMITLSPHCGIPDILLMIRSTMYRTFAAMLPSQYSSRFVPLLNMLADDVTRPVQGDFPVVEFLANFLHPDDTVLDLVDPQTEVSRDASTTIRLVTSRILSATGGREIPRDALSDAAAPSYFSSPPREGPAGTEGLLTPWDALFDPARPLCDQCASAEWDWRCSAVNLLAIIMNSSEVSEQARAAVLAHLLKRRDGSEEGGGQHSKKGVPQPSGDSGIIPTLAVLAYLREHVRTRGAKSPPPAAPMEQVLQLTLEGMKEVNPAARRLHVELLALLFYTHHQNPESSIVPSILQHINTDTSSESAPVRAAVALLCGALLRTFAWAGRLAAGSERPLALHCPYLMNIAPSLIKLAKETSQPVRLWMLHAIHLSMQAAGSAFTPFLKDALRLATAHLLADFFESPLVLWVIAELLQSAAVACLGVDSVETDLKDESVSRILAIWNELKHVRYVGPGGGSAFAIIRTEVLCVSTASTILRLAPQAASQLKGVAEIVGAKLAPQDSGGSMSCAVRAAAARCLVDLAEPSLGLLQEAGIVQEPLQLFTLLGSAQGPEAEALQDLIRALLRQRGLKQLPLWLQTLKDIVLALPPKEPGVPPGKGEGTATRRTVTEDGVEMDSHDDGASMAKAEAAMSTERYRIPPGPAKAFAVCCVRLLLEQANPADITHFQLEMPGSTPAVEGVPEHRLVQHLDTLVALAAHASSSEEASLACTGLDLMLLIIQRFRHTRDVQGQEDLGNCPLLLVQFEAQVTACIRQNMRQQTDPATLRLALELLRDVVAARACNNSQRLIALLLQPFSSPAFEPDPLFCECASTRTFVFRLQCVCDILDSDLEEHGLSAHLRDLGRWMEHALRDAAVLLAGLPLQSVKTYQPVCFSLADYKAVQQYFREALPTLLRGACALCAVQPAAEAPTGSRRAAAGQAAPAPPPGLVELALGIIVLLLGDQTAPPPEEEMRVYLRTIRQILQYSTSPGGSDVAGVITLRYFLDLLGRVWHGTFRVPGRCTAMLPDLLSLLHAVSGVVWRQPREAAPAAAAAAGGAEPALEPSWHEGLRADSEEGRRGRGTVGAYAFHVVAAALRAPAVSGDAARVAQALEMLVWWLADALPESMEGAPDPEDELVAAALEVEAGPDGPAVIQAQSHCYWLWLLFRSPFPLDLMQSHAATTLKSWRSVCSMLGSQGSLGRLESHQLPYLALIANKLSKALSGTLEDAGRELSDVEERTVVYLFALQVPAVSALCGALQRAAGLARDAQVHINANVKATANKCLADLGQVFQRGLRHRSAKVVQTTVSSMQNLLQNPTCLLLGPVVMPCLAVTLAKSPSALPAGAIDTAWGVISAVLVGHQAADVVAATTQMVVQMISAIAEYSQGAPVGFGGHTAAMAQCLLQVARVDQQGLKAEIAALPAGGQQTVQRLLREHMAGASQAARGTAGVAAPAAPVPPKIELKLKF